MDRRRKTRLLELGKDVLILCLTLSAVWLAIRSQILGPISGLFQEESSYHETIQTQGVDRADAARPLRLVAVLPGEGEVVRYGVQYDAQGADALFQKVAALLVEALSSASQPEQITRFQWERALSTAPGVSLDFQGTIPMSVLAGWLAGEETSLTACVRRLTLTVWQEQVALYYRDEESGLYYRCQSQVANKLHLDQALADLTGNGVLYAFETETYENLDPDTLVVNELPQPAVYNVTNPCSGGRTALEELMGDLELSVDASSFYSAGGDQVARTGSDTLRLSEGGRLIYEAGDGASSFAVPARRQGPTLFESVEACRQLAAATVTPRCGEARLYLASARETDEGLQVCFGYSLNGYTVQLEGSWAASFLVKDGVISHFELNLRSYTDSGQTSAVMPMLQAAAAMEAAGLEGEELLLIYADGGGDTASATWAAAQSPLTGKE